MRGYNRKQKNNNNTGTLPSATDSRGTFAVCHRRQISHVAATCATWEQTHLVNLPSVADGKELGLLTHLLTSGLGSFVVRQRLPLAT